MQRLLRTVTTTAVCVIVLTLSVGVSASAAVQKPAQTPTTGQPGASATPTHTCQIFTVTPGNSAGAPGSVFNTNGTSGLHYAGNGSASVTNANSAAAVSQYDIACR